MAIVNKSLETMLEEIGEHSKVRLDTVIPINYYEDGKDWAKNGCFHWKDIYQNELTEFLKALQIPIEVNSSANGMPISKALENALHHGFDSTGKVMDFKLPIYVDVYLGQNGIVFTVTDSGSGFDFQKTTKEMRHEKKYFKYGGTGFRVYDAQLDNEGKVPYEVSGDGNRINIMYKFPISTTIPYVQSSENFFSRKKSI